MTDGKQGEGWSPEIAAEINALRRGIFFEQQGRAFAEHRSCLVEQLPDGRVRRRATREEFDCLNDALCVIADTLVGPELTV